MTIEYARFVNQTNGLIETAIRTIGAIGEPATESVTDLESARTRLERDDPLSIAFTGRYNAGKSTLIKALTGADVAIDSDVTTTKSTAHMWSGIRLLDTPGVRSGESMHDDEAMRGIEASDLIAFVLTGELFDPPLRDYFRHLAESRGQRQGLMCIVNKVAKVRTPHELLELSVFDAIAPVDASQCPVALVDGRAFLDSLSEDLPEERRAILRSRSQMDVLVAKMDAFVARRGQYGRLLAILGNVRNRVRAHHDLLGADDDATRQAIESLSRVRRILNESRASMKEQARAIMARFDGITGLARPVLDAMDAGQEKEEIESVLRGQIGIAERMLDDITDEVSRMVEARLADLQEDLEKLEKSKYVRDVTTVLQTASAPSADLGGIGSDRMSQLTKNVPNMLNQLGNMLAKNEGALREVIYKSGKAVGVKFKPWGAAGPARKLAKAGPLFAAGGAVLDVFLTARDIKKEEDARRELARARASVRDRFEVTATEARSCALGYLDKVLDSVVNVPLSEIEQAIGRIRARDSEQDALRKELETIDRRASSLQLAIQRADLGADEGSPSASA